MHGKNTATKIKYKWERLVAYTWNMWKYCK